MRTYWQARSYAYKLSPTDFKDIVHDAYLKWYKKQQTNLFTEPWGIIRAVLRNTWKEQLAKHSFMFEGEVHPKTYVRVVTDISKGNDVFIPAYKYNPEQILIHKEYRLNLEQLSTTQEMIILPYLEQGYKQVEIATKANLTKNQVDWGVKNIKRNVNQLIYA